MKHFILIKFLIVSYMSCVAATESNNNIWSCPCQKHGARINNSSNFYLGLDVSLPVLKKASPNVWDLKRNPAFGVTIGRDFRYLFAGISFNYLEFDANDANRALALGDSISTKLTSRMIWAEVGKELFSTSHQAISIGIAGGVAWNKMSDVYYGGSSKDGLTKGFRKAGSSYNKVQPVAQVFLSISHKIHEKLVFAVIARYIRVGGFKSVSNPEYEDVYSDPYKVSTAIIGINVKIYL